MTAGQCLCATTDTVRPVAGRAPREQGPGLHSSAAGHRGRCAYGQADVQLPRAAQEVALATRLVWGRNDDLQKLGLAHRCVAAILGAVLVEVAGKHITTEVSPHEATEAILTYLADPELPRT